MGCFVVKKGNRFKSAKYKGTTKDGSSFVRVFGINNKGVKWNSASFSKSVKGKNGKPYVVKNSVFKTSSIYPKFKKKSGRGVLKSGGKKIPYKNYTDLKKGNFKGYTFK